MFWKDHKGQRVICFASFKGGVGKTTTAAMVAVELAKRFPEKVLAIDLDPNNNMTDYFLREHDLDEISQKNIYHVLAGDMPLSAGLYHTSVIYGLKVLPATPYLIKLAKDYSNNPSVLLRLKSQLKKTDFDWVIIDTPPALTLEFTISLYTSDLIVCPLQPTRWSLQAYDTLADQLNEVVEFSHEVGLKKAPHLVAVPTMCTTKQADELRGLAGVNFTESYIPRNQALQNTSLTGDVINPNSKAIEIVEKFVDELTR